jgi:hypothetical protein
MGERVEHMERQTLGLALSGAQAREGAEEVKRPYSTKYTARANPLAPPHASAPRASVECRSAGGVPEEAGRGVMPFRTHDGDRTKRIVVELLPVRRQRDVPHRALPGAGRALLRADLGRAQVERDGRATEGDGVVARQKPYRGTFSKVDGHVLLLDFYADNRALALSHAEQVASDTLAHREFGNLTVVKVEALGADDVYDPGSFRWAEGA